VHLVGASGYEKDQYKAIFAGMAPVDNPRIVTVVAVDAPQAGEYYGGEVAAPVFARVMGDALRLLNVKPELEVSGAPASRAAAGDRG
jgi:cell division protein FtsI (penicillin-binding protein 3)